MDEDPQRSSGSRMRSSLSCGMPGCATCLGFTHGDLTYSRAAVLHPLSCECDERNSVWRSQRGQPEQAQTNAACPAMPSFDNHLTCPLPNSATVYRSGSDRRNRDGKCPGFGSRRKIFDPVAVDPDSPVPSRTPADGPLGIPSSSTCTSQLCDSKLLSIFLTKRLQLQFTELHVQLH